MRSSPLALLPPAILLGALLLAWPRAAQAAPTATVPGWSVESNTPNAYFGWSVASAGDVNNDGYADVLVGAPFYTNGQTDEGRAYLYLGSASGLALTPAWTVESNAGSANLGWSVASAGDVNNDGYADVIIGVPNESNGQSFEGRAYVYHGSASGLSTTPARRLEVNVPSASFGWSVGTAGDVNGDGYADVIVGAPYHQNGQIAEGKTYVFHGSATGVAATPAWAVESNQAGAEFGTSVSTAGDVNGDGRADVIVGAWRYDQLQANANDGAAFVYHGSPAGLATTAAWSLTGNQLNAELGTSVGTAGDFNGDGYADVIVGAPNHDQPTFDEGRVYVALGSAGGLQPAVVWTANQQGGLPANQLRIGKSVGSADVNGDGFSDLLASSASWGNGLALTLSGNPSGALTYFVGDRYFPGPAFGQQFGFSAAGAGDVNGDGYAEVIVGARELANGQANEGGAFVYYGVPDAPYPWRDGEVDTYRQADWGDIPSGSNAAALLNNNFASVYPLSPFRVGGVFSMLFTSGSALLSYLPTAGTPAALNTNLLDPTTSSSGLFGGEVVALRLNVDFDDASITGGTFSTAFGDLYLCNFGSPAAVNGLTVRGLLAAVNVLLGGGSGALVIGDATPIIGSLNQAFLGGTPNQFARDHLVLGACPTSDLDNDGVIARDDNCSNLANPLQQDANLDGYGNLCDADINNSGTVTTADFGLLRSVLGQAVGFSPTAAASDMNSSGTVTAADFGLLRARLGTAPGPSGLACAGTIPCPPLGPGGCTPGTIGCPWVNGEMLTYNQADFGQPGNTAAILMVNNYSGVYASTFGTLRVGVVGVAGFSLEFSGATPVLAFLPQSGAAAALNQDYGDPPSTSANGFGGNVIALKLDIDFSDALLLGDEVRLGDLKLCNLPNLPALTGTSVRDLLAIANTVIAAVPSTYTVAQIAPIVSDLTDAFAAGVPSAFADSHVFRGSCPANPFG